MDESPLYEAFSELPPAVPLRPDQNLALLKTAQTTWRDSHAQWHALFQQGPAIAELLQQAPESEVLAFIKEHWRAHWKARAPMTPRSRREQAVVLLGAHLQAAVQWACGAGQLDAEQLRPALNLLDAPDAPASIDGRAVQVETLALELPGGGSAALPGALVLSVLGEAPVQQLLYLPSQEQPLRVFATREEMESALHAQRLALWPREAGAREDQAAIAYSVTSKPLRMALRQTMEAFYLEFEEALGRDLGATPVQDEPRSYPAIEAVALRLADTQLFAPAPELPDWQASGGATSAEDLGAMRADAALEVRLAQVQCQREAIERYLDGDGADDEDGARRAERLKALQLQCATLRSAQLSADVATREVLDHDSLQGLASLRSVHQDAIRRLYDARLEGMRAELALQASLHAVVPEERRQLNDFFDNPTASQRSLPAVVVSNLTLLAAADEVDELDIRQELYGPLLIQCADHAEATEALEASEVAESALAADTAITGGAWLYWPGRYGGLQRFASVAELEQGLFRRLPEAGGLDIEYAVIDADALQYALDNQLYACEQAATAELASDEALHPQALQRLKLQALDDCGVALHQAREMALQQVQEQERAQRLAAAVPDWLKGRSAEQNQEWQALGQDYRQASDRALAMLAQTLAPRQRFVQQHLQDWLQRKFDDPEAYEVVLDLPHSVTRTKEFSGDPALGAVVEKVVTRPSDQRVKLALAQLALDNNLDEILDRLHFMTVQVSGGTEAGRARRESAIDLPWLRECIADLDMAQAYEDRLRATFLGDADGKEDAMVMDHRRECLVEPYRLILKMHVQRFAARSELNADAAQQVSVAIDATSAEAWQRIVLRAATFTVGGTDTDDQPTTLSGVTFIEEQLSGRTVLVLPDAPDDRWLRAYPSLEAAREGLFELCLNDAFARYLCTRALEGSQAGHMARLKGAQLKHFDAMIGVGAGWPASTSLAAHLLDAHMGRLIQAHRDTSRSNQELLLEQAALKDARALVYLKMFLGVLPFVGTVMAINDAWESANAAVDAFLKDDNVEGVDQLRYMLLSLVDAAMDALPGASAAPNAGATRRLVRQRQLRLGQSMATLPVRRAERAAASAFTGYEYTGDVRLNALELGTQGIYRNVFRHAAGNFIVREGNIYSVELADSPRTWRLSGSATKTYKQPVTLDEAGNWQTHGAVYGTLVNGGLAGGGGVLGVLADGIDPYWPAVIRERLPRWWGDRLFRQQMRMLRQAQGSADLLDAQLVRTRDLELSISADMPARLLEDAFAKDVELAIRTFQDQQAALAVAHGRKATDIKANMSRAALVVVERSVRIADHGKFSATQLLDSIDGVTGSLLDVVPDPALLLERLRTLGLLRERLVEQMNKAELALRRSQEWYAKLTLGDHKSKVAAGYAEVQKSYSPALYACIRTGQYAELVSRYRSGLDLLEWMRFGMRIVESRRRLDRSLFAHEHLLEVRPSAAQRKRILEQCIDAYHEYLQQLRIWEAGDTEFIDALYFERLTDNLQVNIADARAWIGKIPDQRPTLKPGAPGKRVFETVDDQLLVGVEAPAKGDVPAQFTIEGVNGLQEVYTQGASGKWALQVPATAGSPQPGATLKQLRKQAQARVDRLPGYRAKVDGYVKKGMGGKDLEDMLGSEARELSRLARKIAQLDADAPLVKTLDDNASNLREAGRTLRIDTAIKTRHPTEGDLQYLLEQERVVIGKIGELAELRKRPDGRRDFMQEYEVRRLEPDEPLWYAHFHYDQAAPASNGNFVAAHLKTVEERYAGRQWQATPGLAEPWRGAIGRGIAEAHFLTL